MILKQNIFSNYILLLKKAINWKELKGLQGNPLKEPLRPRSLDNPALDNPGPVNPKYANISYFITAKVEELDKKTE